ncbi:transcription elongation regulator [Nowakowskiella sp. JEL0407]|nr:transcription elongation regulator [Nowakowskiella sp. JEL0407]
MSNSRMDPMDPEYVPVISKRSAPSQAPAQDFSAQPALSSGHYIYNNESQSSNGASNSTGVALPESVFAVKKIPQSSWVIAFTTLDHEFFFNTRTNTSVWEMPDEIAETITTLMSGGEVPEDENEENERDGGKKRDHPEFDETFEIFKKQKVDESALEMTHAEKFQGFIDLLRDTDVNPFSTWEKELPKFVSDVRYTRITHKDRKKAFDEYCRIRSNEIKEEKKSKVKDNRALFLKLLESSTTFRSTFDEFSRKHKKDASFLGLEPRERESLFKEHIAKLREMETEKKRKEIERAKKDFFSLLSELKWINSESEWRKVKRDIEHDKRYQAVQQMTERENIFKEYLQSLKVIDEKERARMEEERKVKARKERENASLREREERVRQEREIQNRHLDSTRSRVLRDEAEDLLKALLVDVVKSHDVCPL